MIFLTNDDCIELCRNRSINLNNKNQPDLSGADYLKFSYPRQAYKYYTLCRQLVAVCSPFTSFLLWVTEFEIWPSSENLHLYYRLRQSYGDIRLISEAPAHYFLKHEQEDLISFIHLGLLFGWDMYLLPDSDYVKAFCSHDEWLSLHTNNKNILAEWQQDFEKITK